MTLSHPLLRGLKTLPKHALICGISGQDGAYLAQFLLGKGYQVTGTSRDAQVATFSNLRKLGIYSQIDTCSMVLTDFRSVLQAISTIRPDEIYNLAGQSSVGLSFEQPVETLESIASGVLNLLEVIRFLNRDIKLYNASSSECFGDTNGVPADEDTPFRPRSPYAVAKSAAHWEVVNYRESYGLYACNGILFNHESPLRPERFVTQKIIRAAERISRGEQNEVVLGNIDIQRDWGWAPEYVEAMWLMLQQEDAEDFVIATGETHSLREFCDRVFSQFDLNADDFLEVDRSFYRPSEIMVGVADPGKALLLMGWQAQTHFDELVSKLIHAQEDSQVEH